jgi:hypothetical protein
MQQTGSRAPPRARNLHVKWSTVFCGGADLVELLGEHLSIGAQADALVDEIV